MKRMAQGITGKLPLYGPYFKPDRNGFLYADTPSGWEEVPAHIPPEERPRPFSSHYDLIQPGEKKKASQEAEKPWKPDDK